MSDEVVFLEEQANTVANIAIVRGAPTGMLAWLVKSKIVKDGKQGEQLLFGVAIFIIIVAVAIFLIAVTGSSSLASQSIKEAKVQSQNQAQYHATP